MKSQVPSKSASENESGIVLVELVVVVVVGIVVVLVDEVVVGTVDVLVVVGEIVVVLLEDVVVVVGDTVVVLVEEVVVVVGGTVVVLEVVCPPSHPANRAIIHQKALALRLQFKSSE